MTYRGSGSLQTGNTFQMGIGKAFTLFTKMNLTVSKDTDPVASQAVSENHLTDVLAEKAQRENFNVVSKLLPEGIKEHLTNIYNYCRYIDDIGDLSLGKREENLRSAEQDLKEALDGATSNKIFSAITTTVKKTSAPEKNLFDLIEANFMDQTIKKYDTFEQLCDYCQLSANPVGRLVLAAFGAYNDENAKLSDLICTSLQIIEHLQDIAEDYAEGRIYLPKEDLEKFHVEESMLEGKARTSKAKSKLFELDFNRDVPAITDELKRLLSFECGRARQLMLEGSPLLNALPSVAAKVAIAGFIGGGLAQLEAIEKSNYNVINIEIKASKISVVLNSLKMFARTYLYKTVAYEPKNSSVEKDTSQELDSYLKKMGFLPKSYISRWLR